MKWILTIAIAVFCFSSCLKDNSTNIPTIDCSTVTTTAPSSEVFPLKTYLDTNGLTTVQDYRGFFYSMDSTAVTDSTESHASRCSNIIVTYKGYFQNGAGFDSSTSSVSFPLSTAITGWQEAIPLMKKGATMTLYIPPTLGYGSAGYLPLIPANSVLIFTIKLYDYN